VVEGESVSNPFVAGILRPTVFLPSGWAKTQSPDVVQAVLHHEVAHIANGDLRWMLLYRLMCIALWPNLLIWILKKPLAGAAEELCDRYVLSTGIADHRYADCLLRLREGLRARPCPSLGIGAVPAKSALASRIEAILDKRRSRAVRISRTTQFLTRLGGLAVAASAAFLIAKPLPQTATDPTAGWIKGSYSGTIEIKDSRGAPISGARAWLIVEGAVDPLIRDQQVNGSNVELNPGNVPSKQTAGVLLVTAKGYGANFIRLWPSPTKISALQLDPPASIRSQLKLANGTSASGVLVQVHLFLRDAPGIHGKGFVMFRPGLQTEFSTRTDGNGRFVIDGLPEATIVVLDVNDPRFAVLGEDARFTTPDHAGLLDSTVGPSTVILHPAAKIMGRVTQDGIPVAGVQVDAQGNHRLDNKSTGYGGQATTDATGNYEIDRLPAGPYNVSVHLDEVKAEQLTAVAHEGVVTTEGRAVSGVDLALIPGSIVNGRVADESGKPMHGIYVGVYGPAHPESSGEVQMMLTKEDGSFQFHVPAGEQYVYIGDSSYIQDSKRVQTKDGETITVSLEAKPAAPIAPAEFAEENDTQPIKTEDDSKPTGPIMSFGPGRPFYGPQRLANGVIVKLDYVQNDDLKPHTLWKPDGSKADGLDVRTSLNLNGFGHRNEKVRGMFLRVSIEGAAPGDYNCQVQTPHLSNWNVWQGYGDGEDRSMDLASFHAPTTLKVTDMRFGVGAGPYKTVMTAKIGQGPLMAEAGSGQPRPPATLAHEASVGVKIRFPQKYEGTDARLEVFTKDGRKLELASWQDETQTSRSNLRTRSYGFSGGAAADIDHVALVVRPFDWVTFKGIHLYPNGQ
jgi:hypothetical protein